MLKKLLRNSSFLLICLVLPACYKKISKPARKQYYDEQPVFKAEAQLTDIPLPVQTVARTLTSDGKTSGITFISSFQLPDLVKFYQFEMERLGWKEVQLFGVESEVLLIFEKPGKFCTVSIRPDNRVVIFWCA